MDVELKVTFTDTDTKKVVQYSQVIIDALRKWRPESENFTVKIAGEDLGVSIVSQA